MLGVSSTKSFWHQYFNLLPQEVLPLVAKQFLHLSIDQHDPSLAIHHDYGIRSGFQEPSEFPLGLAQCLFGTLLIVYVRARTHESEGLSFRIAQHHGLMELPVICPVLSA